MIEPSFRAIPPRAASADRLVRLLARELDEIVFQHLHTIQDEGVLLDGGPGARRAGITEWQGRFQGLLVSLGWDWVELSDGLRRLALVGPRSNLRLLDAVGYDLPAGQEDVLLGHRIDRLGWEDAALAALAQEAPFASLAGPARLH